MATRQYIGARYVPKFATPTEWNNALSYEGLTIVTHLGNSFTSKKSVPAGIDIANTEYWANTGNYNAQVEEYRQEVVNVRDKVNLLTNRQFVFISDSYGLVPTVETSWSRLVAKILGVEDRSYYSNTSGGGFAVNGINAFLNSVNTVVVPDDSKITDVVICGGANDANTYVNGTAIENGITATVDAIKNRFPNAKTWIGFVGFGIYGGEFTANMTSISLNNTVKNYKDGCTYNGCAYIDNAEQVLRNTILQSADGIHPTDVGSLCVAYLVSTVLIGGSYNFSSNGDFVRVKVNNGTVNGQNTETLCGDIYFTGTTGWWNKPEMTYTFTDGVDIGNDWTEIAQASNPVFNFNAPFIWEENTLSIADFTNAVYNNVPMLFKLHQGKLYAKGLRINGSVYETHKYTIIISPEKTITFASMR